MELTLKMEKWIESRLWNQKVKNESVTIRQIISELTNLHGMTLTPGASKQLERKIEQIRSRIYKRYKKWLNLRSEWSTQLGLPEKLIQRWYRRGWIDPRKPDSLPNLMGMIFERDYYLRFIEKKRMGDRIPEDPDVSLSTI
jgi:hypothetical protein